MVRQKQYKMGRQDNTDRLDKGIEKTSEEIDQARDTWDSWLGDMSDREQPEVCKIDDPDCEACGS